MKYFYIVLLILPGFTWAQLFPDNPVPIRPGYGAEGAGTHMAVPSGTPFGSDCAVNPVSMNISISEETFTEEKTSVVLEENDSVIIPAQSLFDFDESFLREDGKRSLDVFIKALVENNVEELTVTGHTDSHGSDEYNYSLGLSRAASVVGHLKDYGGQIRIRSGGESFPIAENMNEDGTDNPEGRQLNRRVTISIDKLAKIEREIVELKIKTHTVFRPRNPQIFHVLSSGAKVHCSGNLFQRAYMWNAANIF